MLTLAKNPQKSLKQKPPTKKNPVRFYRNDRNRVAHHATFKQPVYYQQQPSIQPKNNISLEKLKYASDLQKSLVKKSSGQKEQKKSEKNKEKDKQQFHDQSHNRSNANNEGQETNEPSFLKKAGVVGGFGVAGYLLTYDILGNQKDRLEENIIVLKNESKQRLFEYIDNMISNSTGRSFSHVLDEKTLFDIISEIYDDGSIHEYIAKHKDGNSQIQSSVVDKITYIIEPHIEQKIPKLLRGTTFSKQLAKNYAQSLFFMSQTDEGLAIIGKIDSIVKGNLESSKEFLETWGTVVASASLSAVTQFLITPNVSPAMRALQKHATKQFFFVPTVRFVGLLGAFDIMLREINKIIELRKEKNDILTEQDDKRKYAIAKYLLDAYIYYQADMNNVVPEDVTLNRFVELVLLQKDITQQDAKEILNIIKGELIPLAKNQKTTKRRVVEALVKSIIE